MGENFLKFNRKYQTERFLKSLIGGASAGFLVTGICLILSKLAIAGFEPFVAYLFGLGALMLVAAVLYFALGKSDKKLAKELDAAFDLQAKVQTMVAYRGEAGQMLELQRQDAEQTLAGVSLQAFRPKRLWIFFLSLGIGTALLIAGFAVPNKRNYTPPEEVKPFEISAMQIAGMEELIKYVDSSEMEAVYKAEISAELTDLLAKLKTVTTEPEMRETLGTSMTRIASVTYDSSSMTEILNALWASDDTYVKALVNALNTSQWTEADWGDFAEKYSELRDLYLIQEDTSTEEDLLSTLKWNLENTSGKVGVALTSSGISAEDPLYTEVNRFINAEQGSAASEHLFGLSVIAKNMSDMTYTEAVAELENTFNGMAADLYAVIAQQKTNTNVGEYTMKKLAALFNVSVPAFERPELANGNDSSNPDDDDKDKQPSQGDIGEGAVYGSNDLVLDPLTGEYVEYGTLLDKYYAVMYEKIDNGTYTDQQIEIIKNYFALLYSGIKEEGN